MLALNIFSVAVYKFMLRRIVNSHFVIIFYFRYMSVMNTGHVYVCAQHFLRQYER